MVAPRADRAARAHRVLVERLLAAAGVAPRIAYELTIPASHPGIAVRPLRGGEEGAREIEVASLAGRRWPPADAMADLLVERSGQR
jgi:hypothetical protein